MIQRRAFVAKTASLLAATFASDKLIAATQTLDVRAVEFKTGVNKAKFQSLVHQTFYVHTDRDGVVIARLESLTEPKDVEPSVVPVEQFSLVFRGPPLPQIAEGLYSVEHWLAGKMLMNLVPIAPSFYRADFCLPAS